MAILMSMYNVWANKILNGTKPIEFRNNIGKNFAIGETIYVYESGKNKRQKKVVGEVKIKDIQSIKQSKVGCYGLLLYYVKNILKDNDIVDAMQKMYDIELPHYNPAIKLCYIFQPEVIE